MIVKLQVGDKVIRRGEDPNEVFTIEKEYDCGGVFLIGTRTYFCDMVPESHLVKVTVPLSH